MKRTAKTPKSLDRDMPILIKGGLVKPVSGPDIPEGDVLVEQGKIAAIGRRLRAPAGCRVIDARGLLVTPGLVEAHCHVGLHGEITRWEGNDINETSNPVTPHLRAIDGFRPDDEAVALALAAGVTTAVTGPGSANVIGGTFAAVKLVGNDVDEMVIRNPVAMKIAFGENPKSIYGLNGRKEPVTRMAVAGLLRETLYKARKYKADIAEAEKEGKPRPFDLQMEALLPVIDGEIPLKAHAHRADDILTALRIAEEFGVKITLDHCTDGALIVDRLAKAGRPCLVGPSFGGKTKPELAHKTFETAGILDKAGVEVCIITDAPVIPLQYLPLCAGLAVKAGMKMESAWRAITLNPARVAGIDNRIGSLEPGKDADIVLFEGDPLREIAARPRLVMVDGQIVVHD
jgi:imidazolonepropionase-like amidohydrolase